MKWMVEVLIEKFPERAFAIEPAYAAHLRKEYALSIPVFFSQADGLIYQITEKELFTSKDHVSGLAKSRLALEPHSSRNWMELFDSVAWVPLSIKRPVGWSLKERKENSYQGLNRNTVLHGLDLNYAKEVNSYKAFSLLFYAAGLQDMMDELERSRTP